jgi:hypothetical protein
LCKKRYKEKKLEDIEEEPRIKIRGAVADLDIVS